MFTDVPFVGNPVAVVLDGDGLDEATMQRIARWTNLSETTFVLAPTRARRRLPGPHLHARRRAAVRRAPDARDVPRLARARRRAGGGRRRRAGVRRRSRPRPPHAGRPGVRRAAADPLRPGRPPTSLAPITTMLDLDPAAVVDAAWVDNGPGWVACLLDSVDRVAAARPGAVGPGTEGDQGRPGGARPTGERPRHRGAGVLPEGRHARRGSRDGQPQRVRGPVAARRRPPRRAVRRQPGRRPRAGRPRPRRPGRPARSGSAAAPSPASPAPLRRRAVG